MFAALLNETQVNKKLRVSLTCLLEKRRPELAKIGHLVRYRPEEPELWLQSVPTGALVLATDHKRFRRARWSRPNGI